VLAAARHPGGATASYTHSFGRPERAESQWTTLDWGQVADGRLYGWIPVELELDIRTDGAGLAAVQALTTDQQAALAVPGYRPSGGERITLELASRAQPGMHELVLRSVSQQLEAIDDYYEGRPTRAAFRTFARSRLAPIAAALGWDAKAGEKDNVALLRAHVLTTLGEMGEPSVVAEARRRFAAYLANPATLAGSQRTTVLNIVAANADAATWAQLHQLAKAATTSTEQARLYGLLGDSPDKALAQKALDIALTDEAPVTLRPQIVSDVALTHPELAYEFASARREIFDPMLETGSRADFYADLAEGTSDPAFAQRVLAFGKANYPGQTGEYEKTVASTALRARIITERLPEVDRWLASRSR